MSGLCKDGTSRHEALSFAIVETINQARQHPADFFEPAFEISMSPVVDQISTTGKLEKWDTLLNRASRNPEEMPSVWLREATVAFRNICGDRYRGSVELINKETVAASEMFRPLANDICEVD